jgi:hypothetical protein
MDFLRSRQEKEPKYSVSDERVRKTIIIEKVSKTNISNRETLNKAHYVFVGFSGDFFSRRSCVHD